MDAPDTSDIDLDPAHFRCPADLWYRLHQLWEKVKAKYPSYNELSKHTEVPNATLYDLLGENSKTKNNKNKPLWDTVKLVVLGCGVPETELERWHKAWEASVAQGKPTWPEEQQQLLAKIDQLTTGLAAANTCTSQLTTDLAAAKARIDQLTTDLAAAEAYTHQRSTALAEAHRRVNECKVALEAAEARAVDAEDALAAYHKARSSKIDLPEPLERLLIKASARLEVKDYAGAADLYSQLAPQLEDEYGEGDISVLVTKHFELEAATEFARKRLRSGMFHKYRRRKFDERWRQLIAEYQRWLPEGDDRTLELRLNHAYWVAKLFDPKGSWCELSPARKLLIDLYADCQIFLPDNDPFTVAVGICQASSDYLMVRPDPEKWSLESRQRELHEKLRRARLRKGSSLQQTWSRIIKGSSESRQEPSGVFQYGSEEWVN